MSNASVVSLDQYVDIVYRHRRAALCALIAGLVLSAIAAVILPRTYTSSTILALNPPQVSSQYFSSSAAGLDFKSRVQTLQHEILNPAHLGPVIEDLNLYPHRRVRNDSLADITANMITHIDITVAAGDDWNKTHWGSMKLSFEYSNPRVAQRTVRRLAELFVQEDLKEQQGQARATTEFFARQVTESESKLDAKTQDIKAFKDKYQGTLPEDLDVNLKTLASLQEQLQEAATALSSLEEREMVLGQRLAGAREQNVSIRSPSGQTTWPTPQAALAALETQLAVLRAQYKDDYPDVVSLKSEIAALQRKFGASGQVAGAQSDAQSPLDQELQKQSDRVAGEAGRLRGEIDAWKTKAAEYQARIQATPIHEQQLDSLTRDYTILTNNYHDVLQKRLAGQMYESLIQSGDGEHLRIVEPASFVRQPSFPQTPAILGVGITLSVFAALALPFGLFFTDTSIKDGSEFLEYEIQLAASIPNLECHEGMPLRPGYPLALSSR
jgi:succinoglycan biosynthesis transport protein ExoP